MKKRRESDDILFKKAEKRFFRNSKFRRKKNQEKKRVGKQRNNPSDIEPKKQTIALGKYIISFPERMDIFGDDLLWVKIFQKLISPRKRSVFLDMRKSKFFYPEFFVYLASTVEYMLAKTNADISMDSHDSGKLDDDFDHYLDACGLRKFFHIKPSDFSHLAKEPKLSGNCIEISREGEERSSIPLKFAKLLEPSLSKIQDYSSHEFSEALAEIMDNSLEHGEVPAWFRIGQVHAERGAITLAIADNGVGIPHTLKNGYNGDRFNGLSDSKILKESFKKDATSQEPTAGEARGQGLAVVFENIKKLKGKMALLSGKGLYRKDFSTDDEKLDDFKFELPGTLLTIRIPF